MTLDISSIDKSTFLEYLKLRYQGMLTPGYSGDEIIDKYYFCNIKREWDRTSKYIIVEIIQRGLFREAGDLNFKKKEFWMTKWDVMRNIFLARMHNHIDTLMKLGIPRKNYNVSEEDLPKKQNPHAYRVQKFLQRLKDETVDWNESEWCVANHLKEILPDDVLRSGNWETFEDSIKSWARILKLSEDSFIVYQLALDLDWVNMFSDIDSYFILGPGAIRGLNMIYFLEDKLKLSLGESWKDKNIAKENFSGRIPGVDYDSKLRELRDYVNHSDWAKKNDLYIHINDIEFNLCEFNKWLSKKLGWKTTLRNFTGGGKLVLDAEEVSCINEPDEPIETERDGEPCVIKGTLRAIL